MFSDPIPPKVASAVLGVSEVALLKWRRAGTGPSWIEQPKTRRDQPRYVYSHSEVTAFARERQDPLERIRDLERRLDALEAKP